MYQPSGVRREPLIDLLQTLPGRLDDEVVDEGHEQSVQGGINQIEAPVQVVDANRGGLYDHVVEKPIAGSGKRGSFGPHAQRIDLGGVQPGHSDPSEAEG